MEQSNIAWAAGFIDGEGCIHITKYKPKDHRHFQFTLVIDVDNTDKRSVDKLKEIFSVGTVRELKRLDKPQHHKRIYRWQTNSKNSLFVLKQILPYLVIKKEQALIGIEFQEIPYTNNGINGVSEEYIKKKEKLHLKIKELKK